jgi:hypothetical protein
MIQHLEEDGGCLNIKIKALISSLATHQTYHMMLGPDSKECFAIPFRREYVHPDRDENTLPCLSESDQNLLHTKVPEMLHTTVKEFIHEYDSNNTNTVSIINTETAAHKKLYVQELLSTLETIRYKIEDAFKKKKSDIIMLIDAPVVPIANLVSSRCVLYYSVQRNARYDAVSYAAKELKAKGWSPSISEQYQIVGSNGLKWAVVLDCSFL